MWVPNVPSFRGAFEARLRWLENQVKEILRRLTNVEAKANRLQEEARAGGGGGGGGNSSQVWATVAKTPGGGIPARVGTTLGSATCDIYDATGFPTLGLLGSAIVFNPYTTASGALSFVAVVPTADGAFIAMGESCP